MILPDAVNAKILSREALAPEPGFFEQSHRCDIGWNAGSLDPVQLQCCERERDDGVHRRRHVTAARMRRPHPISEAPRLSAAAANIGKRQPPEELVVFPAENEERISEIAALVFSIALDAAAEG